MRRVVATVPEQRSVSHWGLIDGFPSLFQFEFGDLGRVGDEYLSEYRINGMEMISRTPTMDVDRDGMRARFKADDLILSPFGIDPHNVEFLS